jgi:hypothetical protein
MGTREIERGDKWGDRGRERYKNMEREEGICRGER